MEYKRFIIEPAGALGRRIVLADILPCSSIVWEEAFTDIGVMQAVFPRSLVGVDGIQIGEFAYIDEAKTLMYIHAVKVTKTEVWVYGYEAKGLFEKQGMFPYTEYFGGEQNMGQAMIDAVELNSFLSFVENDIEDLSETIPTDLGTRNLDALEYLNLHEFISQVCEMAKAGYRFERNTQTGQLRVRVYRGADKSDKVRFVTGFGNVQDITYRIDDQHEIYEVIAVGKDGDDLVYGHATASGGAPTDRTRAFLDVREEFPKPDDMSLADYVASLETRAHMSQIARSKRRTLEVKGVDASDFGETFELGDIVGIEMPECRISAKARVALVRRTFEHSREKVALDLDISL